MASKRPATLIAALPFLAALASAPPLAAQEADPLPELRERLGDMLELFGDKVGPALEDMRESFGLLGEIDAIENYSKPEILPNGDIIIRRRPDAPEYLPPGERDAPAEDTEDAEGSVPI